MSKYFKEIEENMDVDFLAKLDEAREFANIPFIINSAYRGPDHPLSCLLKTPLQVISKDWQLILKAKDSNQQGG